MLEFCCYGYLIDMLDMLRINMSVTFDVHLVADDNYGIQVPVGLPYLMLQSQLYL